MIAACALALIPVLASPPGEEAERALALLAEGRYAEALSWAEREPDALTRHRTRAEVLSAARDFPAALAATRSGLELAPDDLVLRWRAANLALWLRDAQLADETVGELERVLATAQLGADERVAWEASARDYRRQTDELLAGGRAIDAALLRARWTSLGGLVLAVGLLVVLGRERRSAPVTSS